MRIQESYEQNFFKLKAMNSQCASIGAVVTIGEIATYKMKFVAFNVGNRLMIAITIKYICIYLKIAAFVSMHHQQRMSVES
jgi:hypothetical protein